jgi:hypothetical protein
MQMCQTYDIHIINTYVDRGLCAFQSLGTNTIFDNSYPYSNLGPVLIQLNLRL